MQTLCSIYVDNANIYCINTFRLTSLIHLVWLSAIHTVDNTVNIIDNTKQILKLISVRHNDEYCFLQA